MAEKLPEFFERFTREHEAVYEAFEELGRIVHEDGPLSERERRLVKLGIAVAVNTQGAVHSAVRHAVAGGCADEEIEHAVRLAITTLGWPRTMAAMSWVQDVLRRGDRRAARAAARAGPRAKGVTPAGRRARARR